MNLSPGSAESLYGRKVSLSASRVDKYYACPYQFFLRTGLRLEPLAPAEFDAQAAGTFMHYVLESVFREVNETTGCRDADEKTVRSLTARYIEEYVRDYLMDFEGANARFVYLFRRFEDYVARVALDTLDELRRSDFTPLDFELELSELERKEDLPQIKGDISQNDGSADSKGANSPGATLRGVIDRVDGWKKDGKLYLRIIDYKSKKKALNLSDVANGRDMQMLIYLSAIRKHGAARYGAEVIPAGVLYVPVLDFIVKTPRDTPDGVIQAKRGDELRRGGLILDDQSVIEAMENGADKRYLPAGYAKDCATKGGSLVGQDGFGQLERHVDHMMEKAAGEILGGNIGCTPYYKGPDENECKYCEYRAACRFDEESGDAFRYAGTKNADAGKHLLAGNGGGV